MNPKQKYHYIIGIDPDLHKSGFAIYDSIEKNLTACRSLSIWGLFDELHDINKEIPRFNYLIRLEYPKNTNTYHKGGKGAAINVGKNQAVAIIIKEFLEFYHMNFELVNPCGFSQFFKDEKKFRQQTGWDKRTNEDSRCAAAMVCQYK